ncbi:MAG: hypothetical protein ACOCU1_02160 [Bacillota bacterium]
MKKFIVILSFLLVFLSFGTSVQAENGVNYNTFTLNDGRLVRTQTAYVPIADLTDINGVALDTPNDIYIDAFNVMYIVSTADDDTGKIIRYDMDTEVVDVFGASFLVNPTGIFANEDGEMFVADRGGNAAYKLSEDGDIMHTYTKPDSPLFGTEDFQPRKILSDARGSVYVLNRGTKGLAQFTADGEFLGYFGTNTITPTLRTVLQYTFFTEEQRAQLFNLTPPEVSNMAIDDRGLIHTSSLGEETTGIKKLNISGDNLLPEMFNAQDLVDVYVGPIGNIYTVDRSGVIYEYDSEGNLLFAFGGQDITNQMQGLMNTPSGLAVDSNSNIFVVDRGANVLKIYTPTSFANLVHTALESYQQGLYVESQEPWQDVLKMNDFFDLAHRGMANAYFSLGEYDEALEEYYIANDRGGYSDAFWEVRNAWLLEYAPVIISSLFIVLLGLIINIKVQFTKYLTRPIKKGVKYLRDRFRTFDDILFVFTYLKNPAEATYDIKRKGRVRLFSAVVLLTIYFLIYIMYLYNLGFLFNFNRIENINILEELITIFLPVILWVISNFLIGSIREGEGRFKDVFITTVFSLAPYFIILPFITMLSQVLTYNEAFILDFMEIIAILVTGIYFFFMVKETHFYSVKETISSILISAFTMVMMLLGVFIVYMLLNELFILIKDIVMEVAYRVSNP